MTIPARRQALDDLRDALLTIPNAVVERIYRPPTDPDTGTRPWIGILPLRDSYQYLHGEQLRCVMSAQLLAYVDGDTVETRGLVMDEMLDSIIAALHTDPTRDANAVLTRVLGSSNDEGDPDVRDFGTITLDIEIVYFRDTSAT